MKSFEAGSEIHATPVRIWEILVDGSHYRDWDSGVLSVDGRIAPGETIKVVSGANPGQTFPVKAAGGAHAVPPARGIHGAALDDDVALHARSRAVVRTIRQRSQEARRAARLIG